MDDETRIRRLRATGDFHRKASRALRTHGKVEDARKADRKARDCYDRADEIEEAGPGGTVPPGHLGRGGDVECLHRGPEND